MSAQPEPAEVIVDLVTDPADAGLVAALAASTFPLACPPHSHPDDIAGFIRAHLSPENFAGYIAAADSDVLLARTADDTPVGYALVRHREPADPDVAALITDRPSSEVSKVYVLPDHHAKGRTDSPSRLLMGAAIARADNRGAASVWLGVNQENVRAQRFYAKMGFSRAGVKTFDLNGTIEHDYVLVRHLSR
ncbi:GNAT family N-acetyltransferase [Gordonia sp. DT30]|uniref:GNAT family N-acetyltransferase n=1 Tax=Gordonia sp. DT30 TaxID=3416546 RepID=UPI003CF9B5CC